MWSFCWKILYGYFSEWLSKSSIHLQPNFYNLNVDPVDRCYIHIVWDHDSVDLWHKTSRTICLFCFISLERVFFKENNANSSEAQSLLFHFSYLGCCISVCQHVYSFLSFCIKTYLIKAKEKKIQNNNSNDWRRKLKRFSGFFLMLNTECQSYKNEETEWTEKLFNKSI